MIRPILLVLGFALSFILEAQALRMLLFMPFVQTFVVHCAACTVLAVFIYVFLRPHFLSEPFYAFYLLMFFLALLIPIWGSLVSLFIAAFIYKKEATIYKYAQSIDTRINLNIFHPTLLHYGEGGVMVHLFNKEGSAYERTKALFTLGQKPLASITGSIKRLLADESDELRLLAFNILDEEEGQLSHKIQAIETRLSKEKRRSARRIAEDKKELSLNYWELIYRQLILKELEANILEKALTYAHEASKILKTDAVLWGLLGKIYLRNKAYDEAQEALEKAIEYRLPISQALPYLAEIQFIKRNFQKMDEYLMRSPVVDDIAMAHAVKTLWHKDELQ